MGHHQGDRISERAAILKTSLRQTRSRLVLFYVTAKEKEKASKKLASSTGWTSGIRTRDPNIKSVMLYRLSYGPIEKSPHIKTHFVASVN